MRLEVGDIRFAYEDLEILKGVGFSMGSGVMAILGPNGAGKSTLVKCLAGVHTPSSGHATFDGRDLLGSRDPDETRIAYMSQETRRASRTCRRNSRASPTCQSWR